MQKTVHAQCMKYLHPRPYIHIFLQPLSRKKVELEVVLLAGGSWFEDSENRGRKHLMEHCIVSRTKDMDFKTYKDYQFRNNITANAYTAPKTMGLEIAGHCSDFALMSDMILEAAFHPVFNQEDLDREREIVLREISERRGEPAYRLHFDCMQQIFTTDSYSNHQVLGSAEQVAKTKVEDMIELHKKSLAQGHIVIVAHGGGIDEAILLQQLEEKLAIKDTFVEAMEQSNIRLEAHYGVENVFLDFQYKPIVHPLAHKHVESTIFVPIAYTEQTQATYYFYQHLFLKYGGALYDRLRDELGLIYSMQTYYHDDLQVLEINLSSEQQYVEIIVKEVTKVLGDFAQNFNVQKFHDLRSIIKKKIDISTDTLGMDTQFILNQMMMWNTPKSYDDFLIELDQVTEADLEKVYTDIALNLERMKVVCTSTEASITELLPISS
jgi:predicted Zn-dependent peptidase